MIGLNASQEYVPTKTGDSKLHIAKEFEQ